MTEKILGLIPVDWRFELTSLPYVRKIIKSRWMPFLPIVLNLSVFTVILMAGFVGGVSAGNYNFGIMFVWIVWWLLLMMVMVPLFSRIWCMVCPLPAFGEWLQRLGFMRVRNKLFGLNRKWPKSLKNMWVVNFLFLGTTYTTGFLTTRPIATFILLMSIIIGSIVLMVVFEKRNFCKYIGCPVGGFLGLYSNMAVTEIRAKDPQICKDHKHKDCVIGNEKGHSCPWMIFPFDIGRNTYCGMCLECFKTCPYDNMAINLRPPATDLLVDKNRGLDEAWKAFIMLGIAIFFFLIMQGNIGFLKDWANAKTTEGYLTFVALHSIFNLLLIPGVFFVFVYASRTLGSKEIPLKNLFTNFSYTLVPLGLIAWIAFSFGLLFPNSSYVLHVISDPFAWGWDLLGTAHFPWTPFMTGVMPYFQIGTLLFGLILSLDIGFKISKQTFQKRDEAVRGFIPIAAFLTAVTIFLIWLFTG